MAHEVGVAHAARLMPELQPHWECIVREMRGRGLRGLPAVATVVGSHGTAPTHADVATPAKARAWLLANVHVHGRDVPVDGAVPSSAVVVGRGAVSPTAGRDLYIKDALLPWARLWASHDIEVRYESKTGLGLYFRRSLRAPSPHTVLCEGTVDRLYCPDILGNSVHAPAGDGDLDRSPDLAHLFGPASLANAACAEHANVRLVAGRGRSADTWCVQPLVCGEGEPGRRCVAGQQLLAHYTQHGVDGEPLVCAHRGCNVNLV